MTTGLVHHYFSSKDELIASTLRSMAAEMSERASDAVERTGDIAEAAREVWRFGQVRPAFMMIVAAWALEGRDITAAMGDHPVIRLLVDAFGGAQDEDAVTAAGVVVTSILGGSVLRVGVNRALGREAGDQRLAAALEDVVGRLAAGPPEPAAPGHHEPDETPTDPPAT